MIVREDDALLYKQNNRRAEGEVLEQITIGQLMHQRVVKIDFDDITSEQWCRPDAEFACVCQGGRVVGAIYLEDLPNSSLSPELGSRPILPTSDWLICSPETDAAGVFASMQMNGLSCVRVYEEDAFVGIATLADLERQFTEQEFSEPRFTEH